LNSASFSRWIELPVKARHGTKGGRQVGGTEETTQIPTHLEIDMDGGDYNREHPETHLPDHLLHVIACYAVGEMLQLYGVVFSPIELMFGSEGGMAGMRVTDLMLYFSRGLDLPCILKSGVTLLRVVSGGGGDGGIGRR
jgi:hypothetical protein